MEHISMVVTCAMKAVRESRNTRMMTGSMAYGDDIDIEYVVGNHDGRHHAIEHDEGEEQGEAALALVVIFTEQVEVEHETQHERY